MATPSAPTSPYGRIPGPVDRTTFFHEQASNRRHTLLFSVLSAILVALSGIPLSLVLTPLLYLVVLIIAHTVNLLTTLPTGFWRAVEAVGNTMPAVIELVDKKRPVGAWTTALPGLLLLMVPGMVFTLLLWLLVRALFRRAGVGGVLLSLGSRDPRGEDLEEQQLVNVAAEMAIAAGLPPPRLLLLDAGAANAASVGSSAEDATLVVTRGLLDQLNRDETQAVIGHLVGSVGNGDLRIGLLLLSVFQAFGLVNILLNTPFGPQSRREVWRIGGFLFRPRDRAAAEAVARLLTEGTQLGTDDWDRYLSSIPAKESGFRSILRLPFLLGVAFPVFAAKYLTTFGIMGVFGPGLGALWRTRRMLADATAVQLTRNPDALARALTHLDLLGTTLSAGRNADEIFVMPAAGRGEAGAEVAPLGGFHPSTKRRLKRLRAQGAAVAAPVSTSSRSAWTAAPLPTKVLMVGLTALLVVLIPLGIGFAVAAGVLLVGLSLGFTGFLLLLIHLLFTALATWLHR